MKKKIDLKEKNIKSIKPEPACHVNIKLTSTGSSFRFSICQTNEATGREESLITKNSN